MQELKPEYDGGKSFYGRAKIHIKEDGTKVLKSYDTDVAEIRLIKGQKVPVVHRKYSNTTLRHIKEFLRQEGFEATTWKQIAKDYSPPQETDRSTEGEQSPSMLKTVAGVAMLGDVFCGNQKEKNDWKLRMFKAGCPGLSVPEDWDALSEDEKETRLNKVIEFSKRDR